MVDRTSRPLTRLERLRDLLADDGFLSRGDGTVAAFTLDDAVFVLSKRG